MTDMIVEGLLARFERMQHTYLAHNLDPADDPYTETHVRSYAEAEALEAALEAVETLEALLEFYEHTHNDDETLQLEIEDLEEKVETLVELFGEDPYSPTPHHSVAVANALEAAGQSAAELVAAMRDMHEDTVRIDEKYTGTSAARSEPTYEHPNPFSSKEWKTLHKYGDLMTQDTSGPYTETINIEQARKLHERIFGALISLPTSYEVDPKGATPLEYNQHLITWIPYLTELHRAFGFQLTTREDCEMANLLSTAPRGPLGTSIIPDIYPISREILSLYETMSLNLSPMFYPHKKLHSSLLKLLKGERSRIAKAEGIPPYVIFHDVALEAMARELPSNMEELLELPQVGPKNSEKYGAFFLNITGPSSRREKMFSSHPPFSGAGNFTLLENKHFNDHPAGQDLGLTNSLLLIPPNQEFSLKKSSLEVYSREIEREKLLKVFSQGEDGPSGKARALYNLGVLARQTEHVTHEESAVWSQTSTSNNPTKIYLEEALLIYRELGNRRDECKVLNALASESSRIGDVEGAERLWNEILDISKKYDLNRYDEYILGSRIDHPGFLSRRGSDVLGEFRNTLSSSRLIGISDEETPTVYFQTLDTIVAELDHNAPDAQVNLESQLKKLFSRHPEWTEGGKPPPLSLLLKELNRSNAIHLNTVLETSDGYLICREFENHLSIPHWAPLASTPHRWYSSGNLAWCTPGLDRIPLLIRHDSFHESESLGLVTDIEAGFTCNHFNRTIVNQSIDSLQFYRSKSSGWRAYYIGLDTATRQINLCHLIDHLFERRIADNKLLTALHLLLLQTELKSQAETSQQEANPLDRTIKALYQLPQLKPTRRGYLYQSK